MFSRTHREGAGGNAVRLAHEYFVEPRPQLRTNSIGSGGFAEFAAQVNGRGGRPLLREFQDHSGAKLPVGKSS